MAKAKETGTALIDIHAELKKRSEGIKDRIQAPSGDWIRCTQDKKFKTPDGQTSPGPLSMVILDFICKNEFYDRPFKADDKTPAACFAIGESPKLLVPDATSPVKQAESCKTCPNDQFGSKGAGKACSNTRILALVAPTDDPNEPIYLLKVSATAISAFDGYVATIKAQYDSMPMVVVTEIYFDPSLTYGSLRFGNPIPNPNLAVHFERLKDAAARLQVKPDVTGYAPPPKGRR